MNFLACDGSWFVDASGITCGGALITITSEEMADEIGSSPITLEESQMLIDATLILFALVFGFLVLKKLL